MSAENKPYKNIILLMLFSGLRIGEAVAIKINDIDEKYIYISQTMTRDENDRTILGNATKTRNSKRIITITKELKYILNDALSAYHENKNNLLFYDNKNNEIIKPYEVNAYLRRINERYKIANNLHNHILRHTYATRCIESGMNVKVLSKKLGHKDIETTLNTYASVLSKFECQEDEKLEQYFKSINIQLH